MLKPLQIKKRRKNNENVGSQMYRGISYIRALCFTHGEKGHTCTEACKTAKPIPKRWN